MLWVGWGALQWISLTPIAAFKYSTRSIERGGEEGEGEGEGEKIGCSLPCCQRPNVLANIREFVRMKT